MKLPRRLVVRERLLALIVVISVISITVSLGSYELWRSSVQSQIQSQIDFMNTGDGICSYIISNSFVMPYFEGKVTFIEGGSINKTRLSDWQSVTGYAYSQLNMNRSQVGCKIWFGLTRTLLVLLGHFQQNSPYNFYRTQDILFASYAPF